MDQDLKLQGKRIVVTGAASGIGRATVQALAAAGARLALLDWDLDALASVAAELHERGSESLHLQVNVADESQVDDAFASIVATEGWDGIDVLVHVAGIMREQLTDIRDVSADSWSSVISVNLTGAFLAARAACRTMIPVGAGTIILVGSPAGVTSSSGSIPYGASKGGVNGLAIVLQHHLAPHGIRVHNFLPGTVDTPLLNRSLDEGIERGGSELAADAARAASVSPTGVGQAIAVLASPLAEYLQGPIYSR